MKNQIPLIIIAVFSIAILLGQVYVNNAYAITITIKSLGATGVANEWRNCEYVSITEVWCPTTTGIKIWNPTSQTVSNTLLSAYSWNDIKCTSTICYAWDVVSSTTGNLTRIIISTKTLDDFQPFVGNSGFVTGHGIGLVEGGDNTLLLPVEGQTCTDGVTPLGGTDEKGICFWSGGSGATFDGVRYVSSGSTNDLEVVYDIEWNGNAGEGLSDNRALVKYRNLAGTFLWQLINLEDGDTTFATTRICQTASLTGTTQQSKIVIIDGILYDAYDTSDMLVMDTTVDTCATSAKLNLVDEPSIRTTTYNSQDDLFIVSATTTDGGAEQSGIYIFNGSNFDTISTTWEKILKVNTTQTTNPLWTHFNHASEGEIQVWIGSSMLIIGDVLTPTGEDVSGSGRDCSLPENANILICRLGQDGAEVGSAGAFVIGNTTEGTGLLGLGCTMGIVDCSEDVNPQTNGLGLLIFIASIFVVIGMFYYTIGKDAFNIPLFIYIVIIIALSAFFTIVGLIDPVFLILSVVAVIALAVPKIIGVVRGNSTFGGGSSA